MNAFKMLAFTAAALCLISPTTMAASKPIFDSSKTTVNQPNKLAGHFDFNPKPTPKPVTPSIPEKLKSIDPITASAYNRQLSKVQDDVNRAIANGNFSSRSFLNKSLADLAPVVRRPVVSQGTVVVVDNRPLRSTLTRAETAIPVQQRRDMLAAVVSQIVLARSGLDAPDRSVEAARSENAARSVLRGYDFQSTPVPPPTMLEKKLDAWVDAFSNWLTKLLRRFHGPHMKPLDMHVDVNIAKGILFTVLSLAAILLIYLLVRLIVDRYQNRYPKLMSSNVSSDLAMNEAEQSLVQSRDYTRLMRMASESADADLYRNAYRLVYLAVLVLLDSTGHIRIQQSRTNWEYLRHIKSNCHDRLYDMKLPLTEDFDEIWYGFGAVDRSAFDGAVQRFETIRNHVIPSRAGATVKEAVA
jgi:hypothetical protein